MILWKLSELRKFDISNIGDYINLKKYKKAEEEKSMADIEVGKFTLESLTTGMYNDPEIVYREYIQNAVDSFDIAISEGLLRLEDCRIEIIVSELRNEISIKDNGVGVSKNSARKTLLDIGNSTKSHSNNRGFRGIGRLGGLSYCKKLSFCTSFQGETEKTIITFDCEKLKEMLVPGQAEGHTLQSVIAAVTEIQVLSEQASAHYFIVKMEGVDDITSLLDIDFVKDYISQVSPIPYKQKFYWAKEIKTEFAKNKFAIDEYAVFVGESFETLSQVYKPYQISLKVSARAKVEKDEIQKVTFFDIRNNENKVLALGWYGELNFYGTIDDEKVTGIRVRKGNILIGDSKTLSPFFLEPRFNNWCVGELYIVSDNLIPNARRDGFENNSTYTDFCECFKKTVGTELGLKIRAASKARNNPMKKALVKVEKTIQETREVLETGFNSSFEKEEISKGLDSARRDLYVIPKDAPPEIASQKKALTETLTELSAEVNESKNYRAKKDITADFSKAERKIIQAMLEVLTKNFERTIVDSLYAEFLQEIKRKD